MKAVLDQTGHSVTLFLCRLPLTLLLCCFTEAQKQGEITTVGMFLFSLSFSTLPTFSSEATCAVLIKKNQTSLGSSKHRKPGGFFQASWGKQHCYYFKLSCGNLQVNLQDKNKTQSTDIFKSVKKNTGTLFIFNTLGIAPRAQCEWMERMISRYDHNHIEGEP